MERYLKGMTPMSSSITITFNIPVTRIKGNGAGNFGPLSNHAWSCLDRLCSNLSCHLASTTPRFSTLPHCPVPSPQTRWRYQHGSSF